MKNGGTIFLTNINTFILEVCFGLKFPFPINSNKFFCFVAKGNNFKFRGPLKKHPVSRYKN